MGPFRIVKVLGCYSYWLSDGQMWNIQLLKPYLPPATTWAEFLPVALMPEVTKLLPNEQNADEDCSGTEDIPGPEDTVGRRYPDCERLPPDRYSPEDWRVAPSKKRGRRN